jgi:hypothetical protein
VCWRVEGIDWRISDLGAFLVPGVALFQLSFFFLPCGGGEPLTAILSAELFSCHM